MSVSFDHIEDASRRADAAALDQLFHEATGWRPVLWGGVVGYGSYHYRYASGREGDSFATGFAARAREFSLHIMPGYAAFPEIAERLGKHRRGKACWYIKRLSDVDQDAVRALIRAGLDDLAQHYPIEPS